MSQIKAQNSRKRTGQKGDKQSTRCRVQNSKLRERVVELRSSTA